ARCSPNFPRCWSASSRRDRPSTTPACAWPICWRACDEGCRSGCEARHGLAGARPRGGGLGAMSGPPAMMTARERADARAGQVLLLPAVVALGMLAAWPGVWVLWLSLQRRIPVFGIERFVGLAHYVFLTTDPRFWNAMQVTLIFTFVSVALEFLLGLAVALALQGQRRGRRVAVALLLLPWALPSVVTARTFEWLYHPSAGLLNYVLGGQAVNWLGQP